MAGALIGTFVIVLAASAAQALSGFGFQLLAVPLVAVLVGAKAAVVGTAFLGTLISLQLVIRARRHVRWPTSTFLTLASFAGMPVGILVLSRVDDRFLQGLIAVVVLAFTALLWRGPSLPERSRGVDSAAGFASGVLATSTGTSGPPVVIALHARRLTPAAFRATLGAVFLAQGAASIVAFAVSGHVTAESLRVASAGLPGVALGWAGGDRMFARIGRARFRLVVLAMLAASGVLALAGAVRG